MNTSYLQTLRTNLFVLLILSSLLFISIEVDAQPVFKDVQIQQLDLTNFILWKFNLIQATYKSYLCYFL